MVNLRYVAVIAVAAGIAIMIYVGVSWRQAQNEKREADKFARFESATVAGEEDQIRPWLKTLPVKFQVEPPKLDDLKAKLDEWARDQKSSHLKTTSVDSGERLVSKVKNPIDCRFGNVVGVTGSAVHTDGGCTGGGSSTVESKIFEDRHHETVLQKAIKDAKVLDLTYAKDPGGSLVCFVRYQLDLGVYLRKTTYSGQERSARLNGPEPGDVKLRDEVAIANAKLYWGQTAWLLRNVGISDEEKASEIASYKIQASANTSKPAP